MKRLTSTTAAATLALTATLGAAMANEDEMTFTLDNRSPDRISATAGGMQCIADGTTYGIESLSSGHHVLFTVKTEYGNTACNWAWSGDAIIVYSFRDDAGNLIGQLEWKNPDGKFDETYVSGGQPWYMHHFDCYENQSSQVSRCDMDYSHHTTGSTLTFE